MTILPSYNLRQSINIDSLERAILFSALLLRSVCVQGEDFKENIKIYLEQKTVSKIDPNSDKEPKALISKLEMLATVEFSIPYNQVDFLDSGANYLSYLSSLSEIPPEYSGQILSFSQYPLNLQENGLIQNLEQYLVWATTKYCGLLEGYFGSTWKNMGYFSFLDSASVPSFSAKASLIIDFQKYTDTANLLEAIVQTVTSLDPVVYNSVPETELKEWNLWVFGNDLLIGNSQIATEENILNTQVGISGNHILTIQNNYIDSGNFELFLLTNEDITSGWKVSEYTINNQQYGTIYTPTQAEPNKIILQIPNSADIQGYLYLYKNKITGTFASSKYSEDTSFSGTIPVSYELLHKDSNGKITTINKNLSLVVLPQNDFIANISPEDEQEILELATEKQAHFDLQVDKSFSIDKSIVAGKFLKNQGFTVLSWTINNTEYTDFTEVNLTDYKFNSDGNKFILTRYSQNASIVKVFIEIQQDLDNLVGGYEGEIATVEIILNFAYLAVIANDNLIDNDSLIANVQGVSLADLQNQKANLSLFTIDNYFSVPSLIYQWDYQKAKNLSVQSISDNYGCFEGLIRLETPEARVFFSVFNNKGFEICKVPDKNYIFECSTSPNNSISNVLDFNFEIKAPNNFPNWNNGLVVTKNADLDDDLLSKYNYQGEQRIDYQTTNLNVQDLHFALTWSPNGANFEVKFYLNGNYQNSLIIPQIPNFKIASFNRSELAQYTEQIWLQWTQDGTIDFKNYVKRVNNNQIVGSVSDNLTINNALVANDIATNNKRIIGYVNSNYGIPYTYYNQTGNNEIFYTLKKKEPNWFLIKFLKLSNTMRYVANFNPQIDTYLT